MTHINNNITSAEGELVNDDRTCRQCDYPLKGLPKSGKCPECGTPIPRKRGRLPSGDNLTDAPAKYLRKLSFSLGLLAISAVLIGLGLSMVRMSSSWQGPAMFLLASGMWIGSVFLVTVKRPLQDATVRDRTLDDGKWLSIVRMTQFVWVVAAVLAILQYAAIQQSWKALGFLYVSHVVFVIISFVSSVPVLAYLTSLAEWAGDHGLASRLRGSAWGIVVGGVVGGVCIAVAPLMGVIKGFVWIVGAILFVVFLLSVAVAFISVVQIAGTAMQAIATNAAAEARNIRVAQRKEQEMKETIDRQQAAVAPVSVDKVPSANLDASDAYIKNDPTYQIGGHRIETSGSEETYELEPDDE
ncbi:MAG: hypothetical protein Phyf2KO_08230 [Phycisphaerales bacterium]